MGRQIFILTGLFVFCGCAPILIGATGALAGYTVSNDTAIGNVHAEYRILWDLCIDKLEGMNANLVTVNESKGYIRAMIAEKTLVIRIDNITKEVQRLRISARKYFLPKPEFAQKIFIQLIEDLE
ncbi:MAG: hypothetical protein ABH872_06120 [Candidatus Omnitrophota bacterium]